MRNREKLLTLEQVSEILSIAPKTLYQWKWQKRNLPFLKIGGSLRVGERDLADFIKRGKIHPNQN